jgi:lipid A 3-O-deacylase
MINFRICLIAAAVFCNLSATAQEPERIVPKSQFGVATSIGSFVTPHSDSQMVTLSATYLSPYKIFLREPAPEYIRLRTEATVGYVDDPEDGVFGSLGIMAIRFLNKNPESKIRPYVEGGIGVSYASYRITGQAMNFNFNPQLGIGVRFRGPESTRAWRCALRLSHFSNGKLKRENKGINALLFSVGVDF